MDLNIGDPCDDGDPLTENDQVDVNCVCTGESCSGNCPLLALFIGDECNDDNDLTIDDVVTCECVCEGASSLCPDLDLYYYDPCDDEDSTTFNDFVNLECECIANLDSTIVAQECFTAIPVDIGIHSANINGGDGASNNCFNSEATNAVWFNFIAPMDGLLAISSEIDEDLPDTRVSVYSGVCSNLTCIASDDDGGEGFTSYLEVVVVNGQSMFIEFDDRWSDEPFDFELYITEDPPNDCDSDGIPDIVDNCPCTNNLDQSDMDGDGLGDVCDDDIDGDFSPNDTDCDPIDPSIFSGAFCDDENEETVNDIYNVDCICIGVFPPENTNCFEAIEVVQGMFSSPGPFTGDMASNICFGEGASHANWYYFTPQSSVEVLITSEIDPSLPDTRLSVYQGSCESLICVQSDDDGGDGFSSKLNFIGQENVTYYIEWDDRWSTTSFDWIITTYLDSVDTDNDSFPDNVDNCPEIENPDQADLDFDSIGDVCDEDIDGDGELNEEDCDPMDAEVYIGASCDDGDPETSGDTIQEDCSCEGVVGINNIDGALTNFRLFPNPAKDVLFVSFEMNEIQDAYFSIYDIGGRAVLTRRIAQKTSDKSHYRISINELNQGLYFLQMNLGPHEITRKFIIIN